jgi:hypothetical protein
MLGRIIGGFQEMTDRIISSYGYIIFLLIYFVMLILLYAQHIPEFIALIRRRRLICPMIFISLYYAGYLFSFAWYTPIAAGNRFVLALFQPALLLILWALSIARKHKYTFKMGSIQLIARHVHTVVLVYLTCYIIFLYPERITTLFGGS